MKRTPLKRSTKPIPKRRSKPRRGPLRCPAYRAWLTKQFCAACLRCGVVARSRADAAHTVNNGMSSKGADSSCVPLCRDHHREYDRGRKVFETKYGFNMKTEAAFNFAFWQMNANIV